MLSRRSFLYLCPMGLPFYKYQGTGNDFIIIDNRNAIFSKNDTKQIAALCDRKFGIGADGLILLEDDDTADFNMIYKNADGETGTLCGNGGRCITHLARHLGIVEDRAVFRAADGIHVATITDTVVSLKMNDVASIQLYEDHIFLNTGSPHHIQLVDTIDDFPVVSEGREIRYETYGKEGANINFVQQSGNNQFSVRTYERGVEEETLSCGTGVTAVALAMFEAGHTKANQVTLKTRGGTLEVKFKKTGSIFEEIYLSGPVSMVFKGTLP